MKNSWYAAKCVFRIPETSSRRQIYEERIVLIKAKGWDSAIKKAEKDAKRYCKGLVACEFTGFIDVFQLFDEKLNDKTEIFSSMRTNDLDSFEYLNRFYPEEPEDCEAIGQTHRWFKKTKKSKGCYHCDAILIEKIST
ncbi:MAG: DUF4288 domain-containing protein [Acidobacteriota bacterium]